MSLRSNFKNVKIDEEDEFVCQCGSQMKEFSVRKKTSPYYGLQFYACARHSADPTRCQCKIWSDEKERVQSLIPPAMRSPQTPRRQVDIRTFGQYTAPSTLKRKAEVDSFDSAVGDMRDNGILSIGVAALRGSNYVLEPASPLITRSVKRVRFGYVDAATQTGDTETISTLTARWVPHPAIRLTPTSRPIPRRRLFDEFLEAAKRKPAKFDPFAPQTREHSITDQGPSLPTTPTRERPRQYLSSPKSPMAGPESHETKSVSFSTGGYPRSPTPHIREPTTPPSMQSTKLGLITPTDDRSRSLHRHCPTELEKPAFGTPTRSRHFSQPQSQHRPRVTPPNNDSDDETYGWDDDLDRNMLEIMETSKYTYDEYYVNERHVHTQFVSSLHQSAASFLCSCLLSLRLSWIIDPTR